MALAKNNIHIVTFITVLLLLIGCSDNKDNLPVVEAGDYKTLHATIVMKGIHDVLISKDVSGPERVYIAINFDINNDGVISEGDIRLSIAEYQSVSTGERRLASSLTSMLESPYMGSLQLADVDYVIDGNELTFIVEKSAAEELNLISTQTQVRIITAISVKAEYTSSHDSIPDGSGYTQVQNVSLIKDSRRDYSGENDLVDIYEFRLELDK